MGRIAWFDAKARKNVGDVAAFDQQLSVLQKDLLLYTWMHERYGCDGKMQTNRTAAYFEYPSTVSILLREIRYGIEIGFGKVTVDPMPRAPFSYHIGNVNVEYHPKGVSSIRVPAQDGATMEYVFHGMLGTYRIEPFEGCSGIRGMTAAGVAGRDGELRLRGPACGVTVSAA